VGANGLQEPGSEFLHDSYNSSEILQLSRAFARIADPKVRRRVLDLVRSLAAVEEEAEPG
jgi:hypothetical protein